MSQEFFKKISLPFPELSSNLKGDITVEHLYPNGTGIIYYSLADKILEKTITDFFAQYQLYDPVISYAEINANIWLHRDINGSAVINYYIETPPARTLFYNASSNDISLVNCTLADEFIATNDSTWILDVSQVHSVTMIERGLRRMISVGFGSLDYQTVCDKLSVTSKMESISV